MTHGDNGILTAYDTEYYEDILRDSFMGNNCPTLVGKPKFFFIQACRGKKFDRGFLRSVDPSKTDVCCSVSLDAKRFTSGTVLTKVEASHLDVLVMHSTQKEFVSFRQSSEGSWFIQEMCAVLESLVNSDSKQDIMNVLTKVIQGVASKVSIEGQKQTPCISHMSLSKQFFLGKKQINLN